MTSKSFNIQIEERISCLDGKALRKLNSRFSAVDHNDKLGYTRDIVLLSKMNTLDPVGRSATKSPSHFSTKR